MNSYVNEKALIDWQEVKEFQRGVDLAHISVVSLIDEYRRELAKKQTWILPLTIST